MNTPHEVRVKLRVQERRPSFLVTRDLLSGKEATLNHVVPLAPAEKRFGAHRVVAER